MTWKKLFNKKRPNYSKKIEADCGEHSHQIYKTPRERLKKKWLI